MRLTIREWFSARFLALHLLAFLVAISLLVFLGPLGTWESLSVSDRLAFWATSVGVNWILAHFAIIVTLRTLQRRPWPLWAGVLLASLAAALPGTGIVWLVVDWYMDYRPTDPSGLGTLFLQVWVLHLIIGSGACILVRFFMKRWKAEIGPTPPDRPADEEKSSPATPEPALLARLPAESRAELLHLRMQDHYVEVHTAAGMELLLLRFRDALREVENVNGLRVHRSHWVARAAVVGVERRRGGGLMLHLVNGNEVPVSRSFVHVLKAEGWI